MMVMIIMSIMMMMVYLQNPIFMQIFLVLESSLIRNQEQHQSFITQRLVPTPDYIETSATLHSITDEYSSTPFEESVNKLTESISKNTEAFSTWLSSQFLIINKLSQDKFPEGNISESKRVTKFCANVNSYFKSNQHFESCEEMLPNLMQK